MVGNPAGRRRRLLPARWSKPSRSPSHGATELDAFASTLDLSVLTAEQFVGLLETLYMLDVAGAGPQLSALSTETLVGVVARASKEQIRALTAHDVLRPVFLDEIFRRMSEHLIADKVRYVRTVISWRFTHGDGYDRYQTVIEDGVCVSGADLGREPNTTITVAPDDFIRLATGAAAAASLFVTGKIKVKGDYAPLLRLTGYFDIPKPA